LSRSLQNKKGIWCQMTLCRENGKIPILFSVKKQAIFSKTADACSVTGEELAILTMLISTVRKNTEEPMGLWGNMSYLKSVCSTTIVQPRVNSCCVRLSCAVFLHLVILCRLISCTSDLYHKLICYNTQGPNK